MSVDMIYWGALVTLVLGLGILLLIFLIIREYVCWYFKINVIKNTLEEINESLKKIADKK